MELRNTHRIPPLPPVHQKLLSAWDRKESHGGEVADLLGRDPFLNSRVLGAVNALHPDPAERVESLRAAVERFGVAEVTHLALCAAVYDMYRPGPKEGKRVLASRSFWWHALHCGALARLLAEEMGYGSPGQAFLAGFLHDIGKQVLWVCLPEDYESLLEETGDRGDLLLEGEKRLGGTHPEIGAWLAGEWGLSPFLADAIQYHHEPPERIADGLPLVRVVFAAHELCRRDLRPDRSVDGAAPSSLRLPRTDPSELLAQAEPLVRAAAVALEMDVSPPGEEYGVPKGRAFVGRTWSDPQEGLPLFHRALEELICAGDPESIFRALHKGMDRVFGLKRLVLFLTDSERETLDAVSGVEPGMGDDLVVPMAVASSLLVRAFEDQEVLDSFSGAPKEGPALLDEQVLGVLGTDGFLALPFQGAEAALGTVVVGVGRVQLHELSDHLRPLQLLVRQAGFALEAARRKTPNGQAVPEERPNALQALTRRMVHEANGPLGIIKNYLKILDLKLTEHRLEQNEIRIISEEIDRVAQILERLRAFTDDAPREPEPVDINGLISDLTRIMRDSLLGDAGVQLHLDLDPVLPPVLGDRNGLKQVLINLVHNAVESMEDGGNLFIRTSGANHREEEAHGGNREVVVTVSDDGPGVPEEIRRNLFKPFQGTKGGRHAGLGLSIVKSLVTGMDGRIEYAESEEGGASFAFSLPVRSAGRSQLTEV